MADKRNGAFLDPQHDEIDAAIAEDLARHPEEDRWWEHSDTPPARTDGSARIKEKYFGGGTAATETYTYKKESCHFGAKVAFTDPVSGCKFFGGGTSRAVFFPKRAILIDLSGHFTKPPYNQLSFFNIKDKKELQPYSNNPHITIDWPDMKTPYLDPMFWPELLKMVRKLKRDCLFFCVGGHGRTGTALSIMAGLSGAVKDDPVKAIRADYCKHAVETSDQEEYIKCVLEK